MLLLGCQGSDYQWCLATGCHAVPWGSDAKGPQVSTSEECQIFPQHQNETIYVIQVFLYICIDSYVEILCIYIYTIV
jgi:hypothetical protein